MAITSLILGIVSFMCLGLLAGLPAIILGHIAYRQARKAPDQYTGKGMAMAGFVMGYASVLTTIAIVSFVAGLVLPAIAKAKAQAGMFVPNMAQAKANAQSIQCLNNMKNIGLALRIYSVDHQGLFPFNVSTNESRIAPPGAGKAAAAPMDPVRVFQALANELSSPKFLVCPADEPKAPAASFTDLQLDNISYELEMGPRVKEANPEEVLARCPIHGHELLCDGSVQKRR